MTNPRTVDCADCEEPIPEARLKASPKAELCIHCQSVAEKEGRFTRHSMSQRVQFTRDGAEVESIENELIRGDDT